MRLCFRLLVIDDNPDTIQSAISILGDHLRKKGFALDQRVAEDLSDRGLRDLARSEGKDYDLVLIDYLLGRSDNDGARAAGRVRASLPYTDTVFYSSNSSKNLLKELADNGVAGVFVANRDTLDDTLKGVADTIIGKAVDLSHMRGIAMAEVAEMDVLMEETLELVFSSGDARFARAAQDTLDRLARQARDKVDTVGPLAQGGDILAVLTDPLVFTSNDKYMAIRRVAKALAPRLNNALKGIAQYEGEVIKNRNTLAHAKEEVRDGAVVLRSAKRGSQPVVIDDGWMNDFRIRLAANRSALDEVCLLLREHAGMPLAQRD